MLRLLAGAAIIFAASIATAQANLPDRHDPRGYVGPQGFWGTPQYHRRHRKAVKVRKALPRPALAKRHPFYVPPKPGTLANVTPKLAEKARQIVKACGSSVVSGYRPGARIAGSGHPSLHGRYPAEAVDLAGNPSCIFRQLRGWPGGYSVDYAAVRHVHISLAHDRRERGVRFAHYGTRRYTARR